MWDKLIERFCSDPAVSENLKLLVKRGSEIKVSQSISEIDKLLMTYLASNPVQMNYCYSNSWELAKAIPGVNYVEGFLMARFTFATQSVTHAWCEYKGFHFDVTPLRKFELSMGILQGVRYFEFYKVQHEDLLLKDNAYQSRKTETFCAVDVL